MIDGIGEFLFKFANTEEFSADLFSSFNRLITDTDSNTIIKADMSYCNSQFTVNSTGTGVMAGVIISSSFYCGKLVVYANINIGDSLYFCPRASFSLDS